MRFILILISLASWVQAQQGDLDTTSSKQADSKKHVTPSGDPLKEGIHYIGFESTDGAIVCVPRDIIVRYSGMVNRMIYDINEPIVVIPSTKHSNDLKTLLGWLEDWDRHPSTASPLPLPTIIKVMMEFVYDVLGLGLPHKGKTETAPSPPIITKGMIEFVYDDLDLGRLHKGKTEKEHGAWKALAHHIGRFLLDPQNIHLVKEIWWGPYVHAIVCEPELVPVFQQALARNPSLDGNAFQEAYEMLKAKDRGHVYSYYDPIPFQEAKRLTKSGVNIFLRDIGVTDTELRQNFDQVGEFFKAYPHLRLLVDFGPQMAIPDNFKVPESVEHLSIKGNIQQIGNFFLLGCRGLRSLDLTPLSRVTQIGSDFLSHCSGLQSIDLTPLNWVTHIGDGFLWNCTGLRSLDLRSLNQVTQIGTCFLWNCTGLRSLDLRSLNQVTQIGDAFLCGCMGLRSLDLTPLSRVTQIGEGFLCECRGLQSLDLTPLRQVTHIENSFLAGCRGLQSLDLTPLRQVTQIGDYFLADCSGLPLLDLRSLSRVTQIGDYFLDGCSGLRSLLLPPNNSIVDNAILSLIPRKITISPESGS